MTHSAHAYLKDFRPCLLKRLVVACDISQGELARMISELYREPVSRTTINLVINRGYIPHTFNRFAQAVEAVIENDQRTVNWLKENGLTVSDIWRPLGRELRKPYLPTHGKRAHVRKNDAADIQEEEKREVEMISQEALRHFKLFRHPFIDDIQKDSDIYMSDEHRFIEAAMLETAHHGGFLAIVGEVGSGKSTICCKVVEQLRREGDALVILPQMIDKTRLSAAAISDAIIQDISSEKCKVRLEDKARQVQRLLLDRSKSGYRAVLIIDEAHDLSVKTLKFLKRFYELKNGYRKILGIILIGQTELKNLFDEGTNIDMREVIRRVQIAEIQGLNGHIKDYLALKLKRVGGKIESIFTDDAIDAMHRRLTSGTGKESANSAYPLTVNNYAARAMNLAFDMGEAKVSADIVEAL